jgi:hypothetical protein
MQDYNLHGILYVSNFSSQVKGRTQIEGVREHGAEGRILN